MTKEDLRFHITAWPGVVVPIPRVLKVAPHRTPEEFVLYERFSRRGLAIEPLEMNTSNKGEFYETQPVAPELHVRELLQLDTGDLDAVLGFVAAHGRIARRVWPGFYNKLTGPSGEIDLDVPDDPRAELHVMEIRHWLLAAQAITRHWLLHVTGDSPSTAWQDAGADLAYLVGESVDDHVAWRWFAHFLNTGLEAFPMHVRVEVPPKDDWAFKMTAGPAIPDLYSAICLQLANDMAEGVVYRVCANEPCRRHFVRQLGGAVHGQYRTEGVMYCTISCAKAQAQRQYRRRNRKESQ